MKKIINMLYNKSDKKYWILYLMTAVILLCNFAYVDILVTSTHGVSIWDALFKEGFKNFYSINNGLVIRGMAASAVYDLPIYFIFAIWNFPLWIIKELTSIELINNGFTVLWMRLLPVVFLIGSSYVFKKICEDINIDKKWINSIVLIFVTSPLVSTSILLIGQYDIIALFFILLGVRAFINNDMNKFILWFMIAIPIKMFALFIFIPLLLLREKNVIKIIIYSLYSIVLLLIFRSIEIYMPTYLELASSFNSGMADRIINGSGIELPLGTAPYFIIVFIALCIISYMKNIKDKELLNKWIIYIPFVIYSSFMILCYSHPYWLLYFVPFLIIMIFQNTKNLKTNMLLELLLSIVIIVLQTYHYPWCYNTYMMQGSLLETLTGYVSTSFMSIKRFIPSSSLNILLTAWLVINAALIVINYPKKNTEDNKEDFDKSILYIRIFFPLLIAFILILFYFM